MSENLGRRGSLQDAAVLHDGNAIRDLGDDGEIMRDEEDGEVVGASEGAKEIEDLRLDGDVERGGGLIRDEQAGAVDKRHGDKDALTLAAGELVRVVAQAKLRVRQSDLPHSSEDAVADLCARGSGMVGEKGLGDLVADPKDWVEGSHGLLEDHGDGASAKAAHGGLGYGKQWLSGKVHRAGDLRVRREKTEQGKRGGGFAGS